MKRSILNHLSLPAVFAALVMTVPLASAETLTVSTYYPAPNGEYNTLHTTGNVTVDQDLHVLRDLIVDGNFGIDDLIVNDTLNVAGISTFTGLINANGGIFIPAGFLLTANGGISTTHVGTTTMTASGHVKVDSLEVTNAATVGGTLGVTGASTLGVLDATDATFDTLNVSGLSTLDDVITEDLTVNGTFSVDDLTVNNITVNTTASIHTLVVTNDSDLQKKVKIGMGLGIGAVTAPNEGIDLQNGPLIINGKPILPASGSEYGLQFTNTATGEMKMLGQPSSVDMPLLDIQAKVNGTGVGIGMGLPKQVGVRIGKPVTAAAEPLQATLVVDGTMSIRHIAFFASKISALQGITLGPNTATCNSNLYGTMKYACSDASGLTKCTLSVCTPCDSSLSCNSPANPLLSGSPLTGNQWVPIMVTQGTCVKKPGPPPGGNYDCWTMVPSGVSID